MTALANVKRILGRDEPGPAWPITVEESQLVKLGHLAGRLWFTLPGIDAEFELLRDERPIPDAGPRKLTDGEVYVEGSIPGERFGEPIEERVWWQTRRYKVGTFANGGKAPGSAAPAKPKAKPSWPVDALAVVGALAPRQPQIINFGQQRDEPLEPLPLGVEPSAAGMLRSGPASQLGKGREAIRGVDSIIRALARAGVTLELSADRQYVIPTSPGGGLDPAWRQVLDRAAPLLAAHLRGQPLRCAATHAGAAPLAVSLAEGGAPLCAEHVR